MKYDIWMVRGDDPMEAKKHIVDTVNMMLEKGWKPLGAPQYFRHSADQHFYTQAVIKDGD